MCLSFNFMSFICGKYSLIFLYPLGIKNPPIVVSILHQEEVSCNVRFSGFNSISGGGLMLYKINNSYFSLLLNIKAQSRAKANEAVTPADVALSPPVKAPSNPFSPTAFSTPFASA